MIFFADLLQYFYGLTQLLQHIENTCHHYFLDLLLLFCFFSHLEESIYERNLDLFYGNCNVIDQRYQFQIHYLSSILLSLFDIFVKELKSFSMISFVSLPIIISMLWFWMYSTRFVRIFRRKKCHCYLNFSFALGFKIIYHVT